MLIGSLVLQALLLLSAAILLVAPLASIMDTLSSGGHQRVSSAGVYNGMMKSRAVVEGLTVISKVENDAFKIPNADGTWKSVFLHGANIGITKPGIWPGAQGLTYDDYYRLLGYIRELGLHAVRVYALMPPSFYVALNDFNTANQDHPVYYVQGIWTPEDTMLNLAAQNSDGGADAWNEALTDEFLFNIRNSVNAVHGNATIPRHDGQVGGVYKTDVSRWTVSYIVGSEWHPASAVHTNAVHAGQLFPRLLSMQVKYTAPVMAKLSPFESWLAYMLEYTAQLDAAYGTTRALALMNWQPTDPVAHPNDPHEDLVTVDPVLMPASSAWGGGIYASYNAYPYYPV
jgi:hypothetical protein